MAKRIKVDHARLVKMATEGQDRKKIMDYFGFKTAAQLKVAYANALIQTGAAPEITTSARDGKSEEQAPMTVTVGKRGSIVIPKGLVAELGLGQGDGFRVKKTKAGIKLVRKQG